LIVSLPHARLIVSLRNPADRLHSLYQMLYRYGSIRQPLDECLFGFDATNIRGNFIWPDLTRYFELFDREQLMVILFDELKGNSRAVAEKLYRFLGVESSCAPDLTPQNTGGIPRHVRVYSVLRRGRTFFKSVAAPPAYLKRAWSRYKDRALHPQELDSTIRSKILEICTDDILTTQE
jgi:Sulfotransferase domain